MLYNIPDWSCKVCTVTIIPPPPPFSTHTGHTSTPSALSYQPFHHHALSSLATPPLPLPHRPPPLNTHAGHTSIPSALSYLDAGLTFVGSKVGDSQLIRIHAHPVNQASCARARAFVRACVGMKGWWWWCVVRAAGRGRERARGGGRGAIPCTMAPVEEGRGSPVCTHGHGHGHGHGLVRAWRRSSTLAPTFLA